MNNKIVKIEVISKFQGVVNDINGTTFSARLYDQLHDDIDYMKFDEFDISELRSEDDRQQISEGSIFEWIMERRYDKYGNMETVSYLYLVHCAPLSEKDLEEANEKAKISISELKII